MTLDEYKKEINHLRKKVNELDALVVSWKGYSQSLEAINKQLRGEIDDLTSQLVRDE